MSAKRPRPAKVMNLEEPGVPANKPFMHHQPMPAALSCCHLIPCIAYVQRQSPPARGGNISAYHRQPADVGLGHGLGGRGRQGSKWQSHRPRYPILLHGGGRSPSRTRLPTKFPANREKNREFRQMRPHLLYFEPRHASKFKDLQANSLHNRTGNVLNFTGKYQAGSANCRCTLRVGAAITCA